MAQAPGFFGNFGAEAVASRGQAAAGSEQPFGGFVGEDDPRLRVDQQHALAQPVQDLGRTQRRCFDPRQTHLQLHRPLQMRHQGREQLDLGFFEIPARVRAHQPEKRGNRAFDQQLCSDHCLGTLRFEPLSEYIRIAIFPTGHKHFRAQYFADRVIFCVMQNAAVMTPIFYKAAYISWVRPRVEDRG
jgi:hypothetical protein